MMRQRQVNLPWPLEIALKSRMTRGVRRALAVLGVVSVILGLMLHVFAASLRSPEDIELRTFDRFEQLYQVPIGSCPPSNECSLSSEIRGIVEGAGGSEYRHWLIVHDLPLGADLRGHLEGQWTRGGPTSFWTLAEGRWPQRVGEIAVSSTSGAALGSQVRVHSGLMTLTVVGRYHDDSDRGSESTLLGPGTTAALTQAIVNQGDRYRRPDVSLAIQTSHTDKEKMSARLAEAVASLTGADAASSRNLILQTYGARPHLTASWGEYFARFPALFTWLPLLGTPALFASIASFSGLRHLGRSRSILRAVGLPSRGMTTWSALLMILLSGAVVFAGMYLGNVAGIAVRPLLEAIPGHRLSPALNPFPVALLGSAAAAGSALLCAVISAFFAVGRGQGNRRLSALTAAAARIVLFLAVGWLAGGLLFAPAAPGLDEMQLWVLRLCLLAGVLLAVILWTWEDRRGVLPQTITLALRRLKSAPTMTMGISLLVFASAVLPLSLVIQNATSAHRASLHSVSPVPEGHVVLGRVYGSGSGLPPSIRRSFEEHTGLSDPVWIRQALVDTGEILLGLPFIVNDAEDLEKVIGRPLTASERADFASGRVLAPDRAGAQIMQDQKIPTRSPDGRPTGDLVVSLIPGIPESYAQGTLGFISLDRANKAGWPLNQGYAVYTNVTGAALAAAVDAPNATRFDVSALEVYAVPPIPEIPRSLLATQLALLFLVAVMSFIIALRHVAESRQYARTLETVGLGTGASIRAVMVMMGVNILLPMILGQFTAIGVSAYAWKTRGPDALGAVIPWPQVWPMIGGSVLLVVLVVALAMGMEVRARQRLSAANQD